MAELELSPYVRGALADAVVFATRDHLTTGLLYEVWEIAKEIGRCDMETPWTASRNPFGSPERYAGRFPDVIGAAELREALYGHLSASSAPLTAQEPSTDT